MGLMKKYPLYSIIEAILLTVNGTLFLCGRELPV